VFARVLPWLILVVLVAAGMGGATAWVIAQPVSTTVSVVPIDSPPAVDAGAAGFPEVAGPAVPAAAAPTGAAGPVAAGANTIAGWAARMALATGIPARALQAYAQADVRMAAEHPGCHLNWSTLAGIGSVESDHGRHGGASVAPDGRTTPPIIGPPLDGSNGNKAIRDTDGGALDGDRVWDHAVGPMQFIPSTWARWGVRASGDGARPDPQNIDDAALAAAGYLCASGRDLGSGTGWWQAVLSYNNTTEYAQLVYATAQRYGQASLRS
jgi:membrane-bound lytic murein transglycosylase B